MWAAANDGARRRRRRFRQRRTGGDDDRCDDAEQRTSDSDDVDSGEDDSSDDERSTTESIRDGGQPPSSSTSDPRMVHVENDTAHTTGERNDPAVAADFHRQFEVHKRKRKRRKREQIRDEAPEAAIARLTSSYNAAMTAVGALHRLSGEYCAFWKEEGIVRGGRVLDADAPDANNCEPSPNIGDVSEGSKMFEREGNGGETNLETSQPRCDDDLREAYISVQRVSRAARLALEQSLLLDPVILAPVFFPERGDAVDNKQRSNIKHNLRNVNAAPEVTTSAWLDAWNHSSEISTAKIISPNGRCASSVSQAISMMKWNKLSTAHRKEVRKVSYLSLVNYADLLLCACHGPDVTNRKRDMLDRGAVPKLGVLEIFSTMVTSGQDEPRTNEVSSSNNRLWPDESTERTVRLALAAYVDASELDPTDPTLWFKLACAARALGCEIHSSSLKSLLVFKGPPRSHRCVERVALERGLSCLPRGVPPNRLLLYARKEMENWDRGQTVEEDFGCNSMDTLGESLTQEKDQPIELVLYLPKYSWATLGRILMRASREGVSYGHSLPGSPRHVWTTSCQFSDHDEFGSPLVDIRLSPLLAVPALVLGEICEFLEVPDVNRLACTCRTMPSELASARAKRIGERNQLDVASLGKDDSSPVNETVEDTEKEEDIVETCTTSGPKSTDNHVSPPRRGRVSKRVRSHIITTEKQAERKSKRSSVEYCLVAGTLSCTAQNPHYIKLLNVDFDSEHLPVVAECMRTPHALSRSLLESCINSADSLDVSKIARSSQLGHTNQYISQTSLSEFIRKWSRHNSGPKDLLQEFLLHVSLNAKHVFDGSGAESLSSCFIDCFNMISTAEINTSLTPWYGNAFTSWYGEESSADLSAIAINLLHAELVFKRCEFYDVGSREHQEDSDTLSFLVPSLLSLMPTIFRLDCSEGRGAQIREVLCRIFWLASSYYSWIGRCSNDASTSKIAEGFGLQYLDRVIELLNDESQQNSEITTPHLESPVRRGEHWRMLSAEILSHYKEHLQSSSIVSRARQCFQVIQLELNERPGSSSAEISLDSKEKLVALGSELFERYNVDGKISAEAMDELLGDFILLNEDQFHPQHVANALSSGSIVCPEERWGRIWFEIPPFKEKISVSEADSRPSIIQVLATSLMLSKENTPSVFLIYSKLASAALLLRAKKMLRSNEDNSECTELENNTVDVSRATGDQLLIIVVNFFIDKMTDIISSSMDQAEYHGALEAYLAEDEFFGLISTSLHALLAHPKHPIHNSSLQIRFLESISQLVCNIRDCQGLSRISLEKLEGVYFVALTKSLIRQRNDFADLTSSVHDRRMTKWHSQMISKAHLAFLTANDIAELLSLHPTRLSADGSPNVSHLVKSLSGAGEVDSYALFAHFTEALVWFWGFLMSSYDASSSTENSVRQMLTCSIASAIIGLCGSPGVSIEGAKCGEEDRSDKSCLSFSDYFDSDDSINRLFSAETDTDGGDERRRILLRKVVQCVQCVSLVFRSVNEKLIKQETACRLFPSSQHGPFLPLVVVRVLSALSEGIFELFSENVWGEAYPYGARECGSTIDSLLGKAYSHLHGFSFSSVDSDTSKSFAPESISAAIHLFRCVKRVYHDNRKTAPSKAFETIELALPPEKDSKVSMAIKSFLFDADKNSDTVNRTVAITSTNLPSGFPEWVFEADDTGPTADEHQSNIALLRRGIANELAKGTMANLHSGQKTPSDMDNQGLSGERELTQSHELSLYQKFRGVLADLCYNPRNIDRWIVLSECLGFKAEDICDRLVLVRDTSSDFCLNSKVKRELPATLSLEELQLSQLEEYQESRSSHWKPFLGKNLHFYMQYPWSNFSSLQIFAQKVRSEINLTDDYNTDKEDSDYSCWNEIETKFEEGNYASWANSWAGMFIMALRTMRLKALLVARYLARNNQKGMHPAEVCEDLGTALYSELQLSTVYGYPMHPMTLHEKRSIAERSNFFFLEADELSSSCEYTQKCHVKGFELYFMIGKGFEKIASTLKDEIYAPHSEGEVRTRLYESVMNKSIGNYSKALADALQAEQSSGGADKAHTGGSSHGALECLYRLHASRFKCLLSAVRRAPSEHEQAELESFRIASTMWFDKSNESSSIGIRDKTWDLLADCVEAFHHCRTEIPLFHRAAYRLAQAYNYAPLFHNPSCDLSIGSRQAVPVIKCYKIRGLSSSSANESADFAISKLFDKRRAQLCAVWVTTSAAPSPFEVLNDSIRKYDALRLKYIDAYLDCMRVSERKDRIESVLNWTTTSSQDLAGFYEASAALRGGDPGKHIKLSLLSGSTGSNGFIAKVKRKTSQALAEIILRDLAHMKKNGIDINGKMKLTTHFKLAHNLFQRLNSSCKEVVEFIRTVKPLAEAEALGKCYLSIQAGYRISSIDFSDMESETLCSILERATSTAKFMMHEIKTISPQKRAKNENNIRLNS